MAWQNRYQFAFFYQHSSGRTYTSNNAESDAVSIIGWIYPGPGEIIEAVVFLFAQPCYKPSALRIASARPVRRLISSTSSLPTRYNLYKSKGCSRSIQYAGYLYRLSNHDTITIQNLRTRRGTQRPLFAPLKHPISRPTRGPGFR